MFIIEYLYCLLFMETRKKKQYITFYLQLQKIKLYIIEEDIYLKYTNLIYLILVKNMWSVTKMERDQREIIVA